MTVLNYSVFSQPIIAMHECGAEYYESELHGCSLLQGDHVPSQLEASEAIGKACEARVLCHKISVVRCRRKWWLFGRRIWTVRATYAFEQQAAA